MKNQKEEKEKLIGREENEINNSKCIENLQNALFTNWLYKNEKIKNIIKTGNFNAAKDKPPIYIILPNSRTKRLWDIFVCLTCIVFLLVITVDVSWNVECFNPSLKNIYTPITIIFWIDIAMNCITAYLDDKNIYHFNLQVIIINYINNGLIMDVFASLPYDKLNNFDMNDCYQAKLSPSKYIYLLFFLRFFKINKFFQLLERMFSKYAMIIRIVKLFTFIIFLANYAGNQFSGTSPTLSKYLFDECNEQYPRSSYENYECISELMNKNFWSVYYYCINIGILLTLGTDFETETVSEQIFMIITIIVATIMNATIYGNVAFLLSNASFGVSPILRHKIDTMTEYMTFMKFDPIFTKQIQEYHLNIWYKQRNMMYDESFFGNMSLALQKILLIQQWKPTFFIFNKLLPLVSERFVLDMIVHFKPKIFMTNDIIITEGESITDVYFASKVSYCKVYIGGQWVRDINKGDYFGEIAIFLRSRRRTATIYSFKDSDFLLIEGDKFETLLRNFPEDYKTIKKYAIQTFINSMKYYPSSLFAKLVPNNNITDYLFRKCIYLEDVEEDVFYNKKTNHIMDSNEYNNKIQLITHQLTEVRDKLLFAVNQ